MNDQRPLQRISFGAGVVRLRNVGERLKVAEDAIGVDASYSLNGHEFGKNLALVLSLAVQCPWRG